MIKLKILDKELDISEARKLYEELHVLFGNKPTYQQPVITTRGQSNDSER